MGWTIFTAIDLWMGVFPLDTLSTTVPPAKFLGLRTTRRVILLLLLAISMVVLLVQIARRHGWIGH